MPTSDWATEIDSIRPVGSGSVRGAAALPGKSSAPPEEKVVFNFFYFDDFF